MNQQRNSKSSIWQKSFGYEDVKCLIVCRGPVRLETMQTFKSMGASYGILLSEKDSIVYPQTLAPELRWIGKRNGKVHHVADYMGASREEKELRIEEILGICSRHSYTHLFAGYGFMAEDADFRIHGGFIRDPAFRKRQHCLSPDPCTGITLDREKKRKSSPCR